MATKKLSAKRQMEKDARELAEREASEEAKVFFQTSNLAPDNETGENAEPETNKMDKTETNNAIYQVVDRNAAMEALLGYFEHHGSDAAKKAVAAGEVEVLAKQTGKVLAAWWKETAEKKKRISTFENEAVTQAHAVFEASGKNHMSVEALAMRIAVNLGDLYQPRDASEYEGALEKALDTEAFAVWFPRGSMANEGGREPLVYRVLDSHGKTTGVLQPDAETNQASLDPTISAPKAAKKKAAKSGPTAKGTSRNPNDAAVGRYAPKVKKALGKEDLTIGEYAKVIVKLPAGKNSNSATAAEIKAAGKAAAVI